MTTLIRLFVFVAVLLIAETSFALNTATLPLDIKPGGFYYTQVTMQYEKGRHLTTNYRRGTLIPVNTQVRLEEITDDDIMMQILPDLTKLRVENVEKHTGDTTARAFAKLFNKNRIDLSRFSKLEQEGIQAGRVVNGMSKQAVITAIGYPPITQTPTLQGNRWTYWSSRFNRFVVEFLNDRVARIQE
ncbi:hypothetical protein MCAMS1_01360 [biofilm metagenome]